MFMRNPLKSDNELSKGDLKDELKAAGLDDCIAENVADHVDDRKSDNWTPSQEREEALREMQALMDRIKLAYDRFSRNAGASSPPTREEISTV